jgi:CheY-like chemotaxis protein
MVDLSMPDMSGWSVAEQLRQTPGLEALKIMIVSANAHEFRAATGALHDAFIMKPIELQPLLERVGELLHLTWIRELKSAEGALPAVAPASSSGGATRSRHHLDDLYRLGSIGHVRGIEAKLRELELEDPSNEAIAAQLRALVSNFDLKRYMHMLEAMRANA